MKSVVAPNKRLFLGIAVVEPTQLIMTGNGALELGTADLRNGATNEALDA